MFSPHLIHPHLTFDLDERYIKNIFSSVSEVVEKSQNGIINIAFMNDDEMQRLNREYRKIDKTTDVLSFHYFDDFSGVWSDEVAGEILLSESRIGAQAKEHWHSQGKETYILILHGLLHILGYDHESDDEYREMWEVEENLRKNIYE
jgi:probable rRNA maturation factor